MVQRSVPIRAAEVEKLSGVDFKFVVNGDCVYATG
jgi:hypothetical protein